MKNLRSVLLIITGIACITLGVVIMSSGYLPSRARSVDFMSDISGPYSEGGYRFDPGIEVESIEVNDQSMTLGEALLCFAEWDNKRINEGTMQLL